MLLFTLFLVLVLSIGFLGKSKKITGKEHPFKDFFTNKKWQIKKRN